MRTIPKFVLANSLIVILLISAYAFFSLNRLRAEEVKEANAGLERCLGTFRELLRHKGEEFRIIDGKLLAGSYVANGNFEVPDKVQEIFGGVATIFMGDTRVSTNVLKADGSRAVGTKLAGPAYDAVFKEGKAYRGEALILGVPYLTAYDPIRDGKGKIIGVLFAGVKKSELLAHFAGLRMQLIMGLLGMVAVFTTLMALLVRVTTKFEKTKEEQMKFSDNLLQNSAVPTFVLDSSHRVIIWNKACEELTGMPAADVLGTDSPWRAFYENKRAILADLVIDDDRSELSSLYHSSAPSPLIPDGLQAEGWYPALNGRDRYIFFDAAPIRDAEGKIIAAIETLQDITERRRGKEKLQKYADELRDINDEIRSFAYIVSHDLRAPLVNLKGFSGELGYAMKELLPVIEAGIANRPEKERQGLEDIHRKDIPEALEFIDSSVNRMDRLINAILKLSRLERRELAPERVEVEPLIRSLLKSLGHQLEQRQVSVTLGAFPDVIADRTALEQILGNLLDNGVKYLATDRPGRLEIDAESGPGEVTFHIRDNGRGIAPADQEKVFEIFRRAGRQDVPGEGMGLAYVKALVRRLGGRIWCQSTLEAGTTFSFTIRGTEGYSAQEQGG